jgi:hypothetical protein
MNKNLSVSEYFLIIQKEYLIAEFKKKIYNNSKDKEYYNRVMKYKKEKINSISERNFLYNIFTNENILQELRIELFSNGKPLFIMTEKDWENYYQIGCEFSYKGEIFTLKEISENKLVLASLNCVFKGISKDYVCRII